MRQGKRLRIDAHPRVLITPDTVERQRFGGLVGTVRRVSRFPVSLNEVESQIGNRELAELLVQFEDLLSELGAVFGFNRMTKPRRNVLEGAVRFALSTGQVIERDDDRLCLPQV